MDSISNIFLNAKFLSVNVSREGRLSAILVTYSEYGGYDWLADADADVTKLQLNKFQSVLKYLQLTGYSLELNYVNSIVNAAEITFMKREGGYKEPFHRVVQYRCNGYECLDELEKLLSIQLKSHIQNNDGLGRRLSKMSGSSK